MPQAGWYEDPDDPGRLRWWDGARWTEDRQAREEVPPPEPAPSPPPSPPRDPWADVPRTSTGPRWNAAPGPAPAGARPGAAPPRSFLEAIQVCLSKFVDGKGRASRSEFWYFTLFTLAADLLTGGFAAIVLLLPNITVTVRRLHDVGRSAWSLLWILVPFVGIFVLIVLLVLPGEQRTNAYG